MRFNDSASLKDVRFLLFYYFRTHERCIPYILESKPGLSLTHKIFGRAFFQVMLILETYLFKSHAILAPLLLKLEMQVKCSFNLNNGRKKVIYSISKTKDLYKNYSLLFFQILNYSF